MKKNFWSATIVAIVGLALLLTPAVSEAQRGGRGGGGGGRGGGSWGGRGGYYRGGYYGGIGFGIGYPGYWGGYYPGYYGYGYGGQPYYSTDATYVSPSQYSYYPDDSSQSYAPAMSSSGLRNPNDAGFIVRLPDPNAEVWFQDYKTQQQGTVRHYESAPLDPNSTYTFTVRARWMQNGQPMDQTRQVNSRAGQNQIVDFTMPVREQVPSAPQRLQQQQPTQSPQPISQ